MYMYSRDYIVLSGADGSGKSTLSRILTSVLALRGPVCIHWFRGSHLLASVLARLLSRFGVFCGNCNPYYKVCIPGKLRRLWSHLEFWSLLPHIFVRGLFARVCRFLVCDRGLLDFVVWVIVTLNYPGFLRSVYGRLLLGLATREGPVYLYADVNTLAKRADVSREFVARELAVYNVLARYASKCWVDTGVGSPVDSVRAVWRCLRLR